ncbi:hypothetical protein Pst134EA_022724 [Puccinia striiformis f. sp. tritici]|uniref:hypothetical protein n=1 Tax=Puccinia striiformis f. sp. tritici TaxID=168172 RepID=UPI0020072DD4|nr:hypothetical protein Pst134EA_022724 [Puccinia striiformis f. sp. tritici]KAH9455250.1 hypothetical protein Pst134EA_022724 [Puccinia striiformis f. sp. tritici]
MDSACGTPYPTGVVSTPEGQLLVRRDVDEIVDKVHHLNGFVKRRTGNPPGGQRGAASDASNAAFALKTLIEAEDGQIRELTRLSVETGSLDKSLVSKRVNEFLEIETHVSASRAAISAAFPNDPQVKAAENNVKTKDTLFLSVILVNLQKEIQHIVRIVSFLIIWILLPKTQECYSEVAIGTKPRKVKKST